MSAHTENLYNPVMTMPTASNHTKARPIRAGEFDQGPTYRTARPGGTEDWLLIYTIDGSGRIRHKAGEFVCNPGSVLLFAPGIEQDYGSHPDKGRWQLCWAHFVPRPHWHPWLTWPHASAPLKGIGLLNIEDRTLAEHVLIAMREAVRWGATPLAQSPLLAMNALERALIWLDCANPLTGGRPLDDRVTQAVDFLRDHMTRSITIDELAKAVHLSPSRLSHLFREQVGLTPIQYLETQRIDRACQLLEQTSLTIGQIAEKVGYDSPFYFSLRFKKYTGQNPRAYRQAASIPTQR